MLGTKSQNTSASTTVILTFFFFLNGSLVRPQTLWNSKAKAKIAELPHGCCEEKTKTKKQFPFMYWHVSRYFTDTCLKIDADKIIVSAWMDTTKCEKSYFSISVN